MSTKSGLSNEGAERSNASSVYCHAGDQVSHSYRMMSRRFASSPCRPRSVLKYH